MSDNDDNNGKPVEIDLDTDSATPVAVKPDDTARTSAPAEVSDAAAAPPTPEERIAALEAEKADLRDRMLRIAADFDNWKKRARKDQAEHESRVREAVLRDILEVADNLERASASFGGGKEADAKSIRDGVELVLRQLRSKLERYQVKPIEAVGQPFDPRFHEAISQAPTADAKPGSIVHELQKGYVIGERLLRPAMVVVAAAPPSPAAETPTSDGQTAPAKPSRSEDED